MLNSIRYHFLLYELVDGVVAPFPRSAGILKEADSGSGKLFSLVRKNRLDLGKGLE